MARVGNCPVPVFPSIHPVLFSFVNVRTANGNAQSAVQQVHNPANWRELTRLIESEYKDGLIVAPRLRSIAAAVSNLSILEEDWNDEGAAVIDRDCINRVQDFIRLLARAAPGQDLTWSLPSVYPSVNGGVQLYWNQNALQTLIEFNPGLNQVRCTTKETGKPSDPNHMSLDEAVTVALQALRVK